MKITTKDICAGIVLYQPDIKLLIKNIKKIIPQVNEVFLYDNGSSNRKEITTTVLPLFKNIKYVNGYKNLGIAHALNKINELAYNRGYKWCLTLDQDSICSPNLIKNYLRVDDNSKLAIICPFILNNNKYSLEEYKKINLPNISYIRNPMDCITSGCLVNTSIYKEINGVNEDLFIDFVDTELNCKVLKNGFSIIRCNNTYLTQKMGRGHQIKIFNFLFQKTHIELFRKLRVIAVYPYKRLYFMSRNSRYIRKNYKNSGFRTSTLFMFLYFVYCLMCYPKNYSRGKILTAIYKGYKSFKIGEN